MREGTRRVGVAVIAAIAVFLLGGPTFAAAGAVGGQDVHVEGGIARLLSDVVLGLVVLRTSSRLWARSPEPTPENSDAPGVGGPLR